MNKYIPISLAIISTVCLSIFEYYLIPIRDWMVYPVLAANGLMFLYIFIQGAELARLSEFKSEGVYYSTQGLIWAYVAFIGFLRIYPLVLDIRVHSNEQWYLQLTGLFLFCLTFYGIHLCMSVYRLTNSVEGADKMESEILRAELEAKEEERLRLINDIENLDAALESSENVMKEISGQNEHQVMVIKKITEELNILHGDLKKPMVKNGNYYEIIHKDPGGRVPFDYKSIRRGKK